MAIISLSEYLLKTISREKWARLGTQKRSGVLVPLFSIYSKESAGIGDLADLKLLIDWAKLTGNTIIQLLPMNEMGSLFYPYDAISSFALEPAYISLRSIGARCEGLRKRFSNGRAYIDYAIKKEKLQILRDIYFQKGEENDAGFKKFQEDNQYWLLDFALYKALKDAHQGSAWYDWDAKFKNHDRIALRNFQEGHLGEISFQMWLQWQLYRQFKEVKDYASAKKVLLKGDLPILVSLDSADVWQRPEFFKLDYASGAPADMYAALGQRWGMPTYNWERIEAEGYSYLKEKLKFAQNFYDILRIDHVAGLFRIWSIPYNEPQEFKGLNGFFDPPDEKEWPELGRKILTTMLNNTSALLCAEDLGVIPKVCPDTLKELGIPGNDVQRWTKDWKLKHEFLKPDEYREISVAMLSTHDTANWPAWWENEAGTVDEELFKRRCAERGIDYDNVKHKLFNFIRSRHARLRWLDNLDSTDKLAAILGKKKEELADFIDLYENTHQEKEKLWKQLNLSGQMREKPDSEIVKAALKITLDSNSIFCINTIIDWLYAADIFTGDPYQYRINTPGTVSGKNWSLTIPISLEDLLRHRVNKEIRKIITGSGRR